MHTVIAFATGWGSKYGGINSFNTDFLSAFGVAYHNNVQVVCIVPEATAEQVEDARITHVRLVPLPFSPQDKTLSESHALAAIVELAHLGVSFIPEETFWLGHDRITGPAAKAAAKAAGGRSALIHHMSYDHYESFAENSAAAYEKIQSQKALFQEADVVLAVGPLLRDALSDLLSESKLVHMLIPGLAEITARSAPKTFSVFMSGRLSDDAARIKQGHLGIAAFAKAHCDARNSGLPDGLCDKPKLVLRGVDFESEVAGRASSEQTDPETELKAFAEEYAECVINLHALPYTHDRQMLYDDLSAASVAMMPSWHEGFGLVGWEAIAAGVPLILSKDSGVYKLLKENHDGTGTGCVYPIDVKGSVTAPFFKPEDLRSVADKLKEIANKPGDARKRAGTLRGLLADYTWSACAEQAVQAFGWSLQKGSIPETVATPRHLESVSSSKHLDIFSAAAIVTNRPQPESAMTSSNSPLQIPTKYWQRGQGIADSQLLRAEEELIPFDSARQPEVDKLIAWLEDQQFPHAVRLLTGAGGVGKTRLALELCRRREEEGWHVGFLRADLEAKGMANAWGTLRGLDQPLLIVIDYAETRQTVLLALIKEILKGRGTQPVRILLLARNGGEWWDNLPSRESACEPILCGYATTGPYDLSPLHPTAQNRHDAYRQALESFAEALGVSAPDVIPTLEGEHFERPLYLQMAALLALHGERPTTAEGLTRALLNHERRYWRGLLSSFNGSEPERYAQQLLAISTLAGGFATARAAQSLVKAASLSPLPDGQFNALFNALAPLYPGKHGLQAMRPDLLGEALIAQALLGPEALLLLDSVLSNKASATIRRHALTVLTRLATQRDDLYETLIEALVRNFSHCYKEIAEVAIETNGPLPSLAEAAFIRLIPAQKSQIVGVLEPLLREESVQLAEFNCMVSGYLAGKYRQQHEKRPKCVETMAVYANALINHSVNLSCSGKTEEALNTSQVAFKYFSRLNIIDKIRFEPSLSLSINNYSNYLSDVGRYEEALTFSLLSLEILQRLRKKSSTQHESDYARALNNYALHLGNTGRYAEALKQSLLSVEIRQSLIKNEPDQNEPGYAMALNNYAMFLRWAGRQEESLTQAQLSLNLYKRLAEKKPDQHDPDYAMALNNFANFLNDAGRYDEALTFVQHAMDIRKRLRQKNPDRYEFYYAISSNSYSICLCNLGMYENALAYSCQALEIFRRLAKKNASRFDENLFHEIWHVRSLNWLCNISVSNNETEADTIDFPATIPAHRRPLLRIFSAFVQACRTTLIDGRSDGFALVLSSWCALYAEDKITARPYWLCGTAWCAKYAPELVEELDWQSDLNRYAQQRQGNLPKWMLTVAERLDFSFDLSQIAVSQQITSDEGEVSCPSA